MTLRLLLFWFLRVVLYLAFRSSRHCIKTLCLLFYFCVRRSFLCVCVCSLHSVSDMVYWVMANIEPIPPISAKNFFHLCSESSNSSGITSVAPTYTKVPATMASVMASTIGAANSFTAIPRTTPIGPMALNTDKKVIISPLGIPDFKKATRRAIDSAGCDDFLFCLCIVYYVLRLYCVFGEQTNATNWRYDTMSREKNDGAKSSF